MAPSSNEQLQKLRNIHYKLSQMSRIGYQKIQIQKQIYHDLVKIFSKFSHKLNDLAKRILDQIIAPSSKINQDDYVLLHYQFLSNSLSKLAQSAKKISSHQKQQVYEPMRIFVSNYKGISDQLLIRIIDNITKISESNLQLTKSKQHYYNISQKLQKQRQLQSKIISKIQNGDKNQLQKFNTQIKKLSDSILSSQSVYKDNIIKINQQWESTKKIIDQTITSYSNNQQTRISFSKKFALSTLKIIQDLQKGITKNPQAKLKQPQQNSNDKKSSQKNHKTQKDKKSINQKDKQSYQNNSKIFELVKQVKSVDLVQTFVSHQDHRKKQKRTQAIQQQHLQQIFKKVKNQDKQKIKSFIQTWFQTFQQDNQYDQTSISSHSSHNNSLSNSPIKQSKQQPIQNSQKSKKSIKVIFGQQQKLDDIKGKIIQALPYSFYFIQQLYNQVLNMTSFYCKLNDQNFYYILNTFNVVTKSIDTQMNNQITAEFIYKMMFISQRISWKKSSNTKNNSIQLLSSHYSKNKSLFNNKKTITALYNYLLKKKSDSKKPPQSAKNALTTFTKNIFSRKRQKQIILSSDQQFNCLTQITNIMANFDVDKEISIKFIKDYLNDANANKASFQYLKGIIITKKDFQERRKIFFKTQVKQKREKKLRKIIQSKKIAEFCITITAKRGFFSKEQLALRLVSKYLITVHWQILAHLQIQTPKKWIHLLPYNKSMNYIQMKQQVAQKSVPSATQQIITLDVNRSLHIHGQILTPTVLHTLLRVYAFYHKDISYCQGMNYIAGYLYLKTLNEESAYRIFQYLMEIRFKQLFANQFEVLKIKMYQFDRLLAIFHPQISQHFKKQGISPQCYIVSWIITLFASSYQYTMQSYLIDTLWERFIIYGWKQFFRFILWMFDLKKEQLIQLTYDRALHSLGEIAKSRFLLASNKQYKQEFKHVQNVQDGINRFQVTQELLDSLVSQYKLSK